MHYNLGSEAQTGDILNFLNITDDLPGAPVSDVPMGAAYVMDIASVFLDDNNNLISEVPANKLVYIAMRLTLGEHKGVITTSKGLPAATITPYTPEPDVLEVIAESLSVDVGEIKFLTDDNISAETPEPTEETQKYVQEDSHEIIGKINTITVDQDGFYVFKVSIDDDELWAQLENQNVEDFKIYLQSNPEVLSNSVNISFWGVLNSMEILTMSGRKLKTFGFKDFLLGGFLNSTQPLTLFIAKAILAFFTGGLGAGCNAGFAGAICFLVLWRFLRKR